MSLADDYALYYSGTYVGFRERSGNISPFLVDSVRWDNSVSISRNGLNDLSNLQHLIFRGNKLVRRGENDYQYQDLSSISINDLILDVPLLGYYEIDGIREPVWLYHLPQRSTKKGFTQNKTNIPQVMRTNTNSFNKLVYKIYNDNRQKLERDFHQNLSTNNLLYKGINIGKVIPENGVKLKKSANYLTPLVSSFMSGV